MGYIKVLFRKEFSKRSFAALHKQLMGGGFWGGAKTTM